MTMHRETTRLLDSSDIILEIANGRILRGIYVFAFLFTRDRESIILTLKNSCRSHASCLARFARENLIGRFP